MAGYVKRITTIIHFWKEIRKKEPDKHTHIHTRTLRRSKSFIRRDESLTKQRKTSSHKDAMDIVPVYNFLNVDNSNRAASQRVSQSSTCLRVSRCAYACLHQGARTIDVRKLIMGNNKWGRRIGQEAILYGIVKYETDKKR